VRDGVPNAPSAASSNEGVSLPHSEGASSHPCAAWYGAHVGGAGGGGPAGGAGSGGVQPMWRMRVYGEPLQSFAA